MKTIGNIIWFLLGGFIAFILWSVAGLLVCITIIGIPFGKQHVKFAQLSIVPFNSKVISQNKG